MAYVSTTTPPPVPPATSQAPEFPANHFLRIPCTTAGTTEFDGCPSHLGTRDGQKYSSFDVAAWSDLWFYSNPIFIEVIGLDADRRRATEQHVCPSERRAATRGAFRISADEAKIMATTIESMNEPFDVHARPPPHPALVARTAAALRCCSAACCSASITCCSHAPTIRT